MTTRQPHFIGIDLGLIDGTTIAIGHLDEQKQIVADLVDHQRLDKLDAVADWILNLSQQYYFVKGMFDQWLGVAFEQALAKRGLRQLELKYMTKDFVSELDRNFELYAPNKYNVRSDALARMVWLASRTYDQGEQK